MRYDFQVKDDKIFRDDTGYFFPSKEAAIAYAQTIADELLKEPNPENAAIVITDDSVAQIAKVPITPDCA